METITGTAAGVPFTALPLDGNGAAPLIVTWQMLDAPRTDAAFAAALPMLGVPAWRVHLGMPWCGARMVDGRLDAHVQRARRMPCRRNSRRSSTRPSTSSRPRALRVPDDVELVTVPDPAPPWPTSPAWNRPRSCPRPGPWTSC